jgi:2-polyprenyl-3-methyl-5-hydroxy-6-metoxy-1,4-benzoquinol methylase
MDRKWFSIGSNPNESILTKIKEQKWTAHNIPLTDSYSTMGDSIPLINEDRRTRLILDHLRFLMQGELSGLRLIDLGCLEGGLSFVMACEGMKVLGVEGRVSNYDKCMLIKKYYDNSLSNLEFLCSDVRDLKKEAHGMFDVVLCCGLLYHLDHPMSFLETLSGITSDHGILFLDTHVSPSEIDLVKCTFVDRLSNSITMDYRGVSYEGRWYLERPAGMDGTDDEWAAVSNDKAFWLTFRSLITALYHAGFNRIYNIYGGWSPEEEFDMREKYSRLYCIATKAAW